MIIMTHKIKVIKSNNIYPNQLFVLKSGKEVFSVEVGLNPDLTPIFKKPFFIKLFENHPHYNDISSKGIALIQLDLEDYEELKKAKDYLLMCDLFKKDIRKFLKKLAENTFYNVKVAYFGIRVDPRGRYGKHCLTVNEFGKIRFRSIGIHGIIKEETNLRKKSGGCVRVRKKDILRLSEYIEVDKTIFEITEE